MAKTSLSRVGPGAGRGRRPRAWVHAPAAGRPKTGVAASRPVKAHVVHRGCPGASSARWTPWGRSSRSKRSTVGSEVEGRVAQVFVDVGDAVARGRALVKIVPVELGLTLEQERAALEQIKARLTNARGAAPPSRTRRRPQRSSAPTPDRTDAEQKYLRAKELFAQGLISRGSLRRGAGALQRRAGGGTTWPCRTCSPCARRPRSAPRPWPWPARS